MTYWLEKRTILLKWYHIFVKITGIQVEQNQINLSQKKMKKMSEEEVNLLWQEYIKDRENKKLKDSLVVNYIYLIKYVAGRMRVNLPDTIASEDIESFGIEGLIKAIERYSPDKNTRFETYALTRIRGEIIDQIRAQDWIPRVVRRQQKEINGAIQVLQKQTGKIPNEEEIAKYMNTTPERIKEVLKLAGGVQVVSLNLPKDTQDQQTEIIDTIEDEKIQTPLEKLEEKDAKKELIQGLSRLPERERLVLTLYYHENMTFKEIGDILEISESRCCQVHAQAIMKLRNILSTNRLGLRKIVE